MNKTTRIIVSVIFGLVISYYAKNFVIYLFSIGKPKPWDKEYTKTIYDTLYKSVDTLFQDDQSKRDWTGCVLNKLQSVLPTGVESLSSDSAYRLSYRLGKDCVSENSNLHYKAWTATYTHTLKKVLLVSPLLKDFKQEYKEPFCDCYIKKLKEGFPTGIPKPIPQGKRDSMLLYCIKFIKKSN